MVDEQRIIDVEGPGRRVIQKQFIDDPGDGDCVLFVYLPLALDVDDGPVVLLIEIRNVNPGDLTRPQPVGQHQRDYQFVPLADQVGGVDGIHQPGRILLGQRRLAMFPLFETTFDPESDPVIIPAAITEPVKQFYDGNVT